MFKSGRSRRLVWFMLLAQCALPVGRAAAESPHRPLAGAASGSQVIDVALDARGGLRGQLVNAAGEPLAGRTVTAVRGQQALGRSVTDARGRFVFEQLTGGVYRVATPEAVAVCRCWAVNTAPPAARGQMLLVAHQDVQRGQQDFHTAVTNPLLIGALLAAAIAIPIAVATKDDEPSS